MRENEGRAAIKTELPKNPSEGVPETMASSPINLEEIREQAERQGDSGEQRSYAPDWTIYPSTQLTRPLVRAEWVARALPPAKLTAYSGTQMFDICDIANRSVVLVS